jgi:hypothetical protein
VVASNGSGFVVGWRNEAAFAAAVTAAGERGAETVLAPAGDRVRRQVFDIVWSGHRYVSLVLQATSIPCSRLVCPEDHDLQSIEFDAALTVGVPRSIQAVSAAAGSILDAALATDGVNVLHAWTAFSRPFVTTALSIQEGTGAPRLVATGAQPVEAVWDGSRFLLGWTAYPDQGLFVMPLDEAATEVTARPSGFALSAGRGRALIAYGKHLLPTPQAHSGTLERGFVRFATDGPRRRVVREQ